MDYPPLNPFKRKRHERLGSASTVLKPPAADSRERYWEAQQRKQLVLARIYEGRVNFTPGRSRSAGKIQARKRRQESSASKSNGQVGDGLLEHKDASVGSLRPDEPEVVED